MSSPQQGTTYERAAGAPTPDDSTIAQMLAEVGRVRGSGQTDAQMLPKRISPSRAADFKTCPQMFWFRSIAKLSSPPSEATARGTVAHAAFERIFDHPCGERTPELAKSYIRPAWQELVEPTIDVAKTPPGGVKHTRAMTNAAAYRELAPAGSPTEAAILAYAEQMVDNWFAMERVNNFDPSAVTLPSGDQIDGRELHVGAAMFGVYLHGFIDRLDSWTTPAGARSYAISDYKSGKIPGTGKQYSPAVMERIAWDSFFQLRVYALLAWEIYQMPVTQVRLVYVATGDRDRGIKTLAVTQEVINRTRSEVRAIWNQMTRAAATGTWAPRPSALCGWCWYQPICPSTAAHAEHAAS